MNLAINTETVPKPWGVLMLDTQFPRWPGDIGCPDGWPIELLYQKVKGMFPNEIVRSAQALQQHDVLPLFVQAAQALISRGAGGITTSCGFLVLLQNELQSRLPVPVRTSSLLLLPKLLTENESVGVLTMDGLALGDAHFLAAGVLPRDLSRLRVQGVSRSEEFASFIMENRILTELKNYFEPSWNLDRGGAELVKYFKEINFTEKDFRGWKTTRLMQINRLTEQGNLDTRLRKKYV